MIKGGDLFVSSSIALAERAKLPKALIGGTLVSLATTSPELAVSVTASLRGNSGVALGNALGSVICNIGLIVGVLCTLRPFPVEKKDFRFPSLFMLGSGVLLTLFSLHLRLGRTAGGCLIFCGAIYLLLDYLRHQKQPEVGADPKPSYAVGRSLFYFMAGAAMVIGGSRLLSDGAEALARLAGVPPMIIGLTLVAVGTSLPELVTAITSARKGVPDLSLGNLVGANIMNITLITGAAALISPLEMSRRAMAYNLSAMLVFCITLIILARTERQLSRREGLALLGIYGAYLVGLAVLRA